jgi:hypothetical protein
MCVWRRRAYSAGGKVLGTFLRVIQSYASKSIKGPVISLSKVLCQGNNWTSICAKLCALRYSL